MDKKIIRSKITRPFFIALMLFISFIGVKAQSGFVFRYSTLNDEIPTSIIEIPDHGYIISAGIGTYSVEYQGLLIRIDRNGDTLFSKKLGLSEYGGPIRHLLQLENGTYLAIGAKIPLSGKPKLWLLNFNDSLGIIKDTSYVLDLESLFIYSGLINHSQNVIVYGCGYLDSISSCHPFIFSVTPTLDSIQYKFFNIPSGQWVYSMIEKPDTSGYLMMITGTYLINTNSPSQILKMDNLFNFNQIDSIPGHLEMYLDSKFLNNREILITGKRTYEFSNPRTDKLGILRLDTSLLVNKEYFLGPEDTISYPAAYTNLDYTDPNKIYYGGTANISFSSVFPSSTSYILIGRFDTALNLAWQKYFGGDQYYIVRSLTATSDGGCIISATSYDYKRQNQEQDLYVIKIDSNGLVSGENNLPPVRLLDAIVYPNPGNDIIYVETQLRKPVFRLYDLTGREVCSIDLVQGRNSISVQNLISGLYIYKVTQDSQVKEYGKWIKE